LARTPWDLATPVALLIFNRPGTTRQVFEAVRAARPRHLLVVADGPRRGREGEEQRCCAARAVIEAVDWDCLVQTNYAEENLGCMRRVSSGLDWVFSEVDEAIILEDDCLPHPSFFPFCVDLLERYRNEPRIAQISGDNFQFGRRQESYSYYFSRYNHIWGWATWRRAWEMHDNEMTVWPQFRDNNLLDGRLSGKREVVYWMDVFNKVYTGEIDTWDCRWTFSCWKNNLLTVLPSKNLVSNIGFGPGATHTPVPNRYAAMKTQEMEFPLCHPPDFQTDVDADDYSGVTMFQKPLLLRRILNRIRKAV
jgi:hypothetical protein